MAYARINQLRVTLLLVAIAAPGCDLTDDAAVPDGAEAGDVATDGEASAENSTTVDFGAGPVEVSYTVSADGMAVIEGDMIIGSAEAAAAGRIAFESREQHEGAQDGFIRSALSHLNAWPGGRIPFVIDPVAFPAGSTMEQRIQSAITTWNQSTIVRLVPHNFSNQFEHFVTFTGATRDMSPTEGRAALGFQPLSAQLVRLGSRAATSTILHEIGHTVGLHHEHVRTDRDASVTVNWDNIRPGREGNFNTYLVSGLVGLNFGPYDISSLMHYGSFTFARDARSPTLVRAGCSANATSAACTFPAGRRLTTGDIAGVTRLVSGDPLVKFKLRNEAANRCLRPEGGTRRDGARVVLSSCTNSASRRWYEFKRPGTARVMIINAHSRLCLERGDDNRLVQRSCDGGAAQRFTFQDTGFFSGDLMRRGSRCVLRTANNPQPLFSTSCANSPGRRWFKDIL